MNKLRIAVVTCMSVVIFTAVMAMPLGGCSCTSTQDDQVGELSLQEQRSQINYMLSFADIRLYNSISLEECMDDNDNPYYIGVLADDLNAVLDELVDVYNADPTTNVPITVDEVRYSLTAGILQSSSVDTESNPTPIFSFLIWTNEKADLVYSGYDVDTDGTEHFEGDKVEDDVTNYRFLSNRSISPNTNYRYAWE